MTIRMMRMMIRMMMMMTTMKKRTVCRIALASPDVTITIAAVCDILATQLQHACNTKAKHVAAHKKLHQQCQAKIDQAAAAIQQRYQPKLDTKESSIKECTAEIENLMPQVEERKQHIRSKGFAGMTTDDLQLVLVLCKAKYDRKKVEATKGEENRVDEELLAMCDSESAVSSTLGIDMVADCTRVVTALKSIASGGGVPDMRDITLDGSDLNPNSWSIEQFVQWAATTESIKDLVPTLREHRFAGDIIQTMDLSHAVPLLAMPAKSTVQFRKEMAALRARAKTASTAQTYSAPAASAQTGDVYASSLVVFVALTVV